MPKLRVTYSSCGEPPPQCAHRRSAEIDRDDVEPAAEADFGDDFRGRTVERDACDEVFDLVRLDVSLALLDLPRKDDVFEVEDREAVIFTLFGGMG